MNSIFIFLFLALFPLGQIIRIGILQPMDVVVGLAAFYAIFKRLPRPGVFKYFQNILLIFSFSWLFGAILFKETEVFYGLLYLVRLSAYFYFFIYVWNFAKKSSKNKNLLLDSSLGISIISAIFGWIQLFNFPDLKLFFVWGWDMHLFRLVGTFLDPAFLGLIIVLGLILAMHRYIVNKKTGYLLTSLFLLVSLAFTYSRASYLAFLVGIGYLLYAKRKIGYIIYSVLILGALIFILPTTRNHSIEFFRSFSAIARIENYQTTLKIFSKSPVFGIGYDNICLAYQKYIGPQSFSSHSCSGADSSLLFVLATTGAAGLMAFIYSLLRIASSLKRDTNFLVLSASFWALAVHSLFSNSLFYPWIMGFILILLATTTLRSEI